MPDGHRLGLVLDRVDRSGELLDRACQRGGEVVDQRARRGDLAGVAAVALERRVAGQVAQQPAQAHRGGRLEVPVVQTRAQPVVEPLAVRADPGADAAQHVVAVERLGERHLDQLARLAQRTGRRVDRQRRLVAEQVPDHRREHEGQRRVHRRHGDHRRRGGEALVGVGGDDDRGGLVGLVDRHLLGHVVGRAAGQPGRAHQDQRLAGQVDVLLVLGDVAGDRLVAQLGELDPHLVGGDDVRPVADDRPVAALRGEALGGLGDGAATGQHGAHRRPAARASDASSSWRPWSVPDAGGLGERARQQRAGGDLRVERLRRGDAHLHVAPVARVDHAVGLVGEVAVATVDDRDHGGATRSGPGRRCGWCRSSSRSG